MAPGKVGIAIRFRELVRPVGSLTASYLKMMDLIQANIHLLKQAERLITAVADADYAARDRTLYGSSLGQHLRHCLDHYTSFLKGLPESAIDYDYRARVEALECSTECAVDQIKRLRGDLENTQMLVMATKVRVKMDCGGGEGQWHASTLGRELQFLVSHTVHHFAMINGMCSHRGLEMEEGFGLAPSTIRHRELMNID